MQEMVNIYVYGKKYSVPGDLTIMTAMEYAGYQLKRGCGCRHGFCGACATIYRIKGKNELKTCLACQTQVEDGMYIASLPFYPIDKRTYDIEEISAEQRVMMDLYPEIYSCVGCNACTKGCPQDLNVMQYIAYAQRGDFKKCAEESFDCIGCGICAKTCTHDAITVENNVAYIDFTKCKLCRECEAMCPTGAIIGVNFPKPLDKDAVKARVQERQKKAREAAAAAAAAVKKEEQNNG